MKKIFFLFLITLLPQLVFAETIQDTIYSVEKGENGEETFLRLMGGRVAFFKEDDNQWARTLDQQEGQRVEIELDQNLTIQSLIPLPLEDEQEELPPASTSLEPQKMIPSVIPNWSEALKIWRGMNRSYKNVSECSDRAHVWANEEWRKNSLNSSKTFLFFTNTYIRAYRFHWWFHVSPAALVYEYGKEVEHIFDRRYASIPLHMKQWTDIFMKSNRTCPETTYRHYRNNRNGKEHCFVVRADMFYRLPLHVRNLEDYGSVKTQFSNSEVNFSYRAFTKRN